MNQDGERMAEMGNKRVDEPTAESKMGNQPLSIESHAGSAI